MITKEQSVRLNEKRQEQQKKKWEPTEREVRRNYRDNSSLNKRINEGILL